MECDILLKNINIINEIGEVSFNKNIYIKNGVINKIDSNYNNNECEIYDCSGYYATPGLVNLHAHSPMNIFKGIAEDVNIDNWFNREIWPYESKITDEDVYYGALLSICEMIENGVTAFADHYFYASKICDAVIDSGIKGDIAPTIFGMTDDVEDQIIKTIKLIQNKNGENNRLKLRMGPHSPYTCNIELLKRIVEISKDLNVGIHIHVSETMSQVKESLKAYKKTPIEVLYECGAFDIPVILGHALWIQEKDVDIINNNTFIATCPKTYMKLAMGQGNIWNFAKRLPLCIGTDGAASSNTINPLEQARLFALTGKFIKDDPEGFDLKYIWKILMRGHKALNFNSGKIEKGYAADLAIWNLNDVNTMPMYNPLAALIYSADSRNIIHTIVDGKFLKKDYKLTINKDAILNEVTRRMKDILKTGKGTTNLYF